MGIRIQDGQCSLCGGTFAPSTIGAHLRSCIDERLPHGERGRSKAKAGFHIAAEGRYAPDYWIHLAVPKSTTLLGLDWFLRGLWLKCCGHMSSFEIKKVQYASEISPHMLYEMGAQSMDLELAEVLRSRQKLRHKYDFGTATYLDLMVVSSIDIASNSAIRLLARNHQPTIPCGECGREAIKVCSNCGHQSRRWLCDRCAKKHACGEEMLLPVANSPLVGECAYTGPDATHHL